MMVRLDRGESRGTGGGGDAEVINLQIPFYDVCVGRERGYPQFQNECTKSLILV